MGRQGVRISKSSLGMSQTLSLLDNWKWRDLLCLLLNCAVHTFLTLLVSLDCIFIQQASHSLSEKTSRWYKSVDRENGISADQACDSRQFSVAPSSSPATFLGTDLQGSSSKLAVKSVDSTQVQDSVLAQAPASNITSRETLSASHEAHADEADVADVTSSPPTDPPEEATSQCTPCQTQNGTENSSKRVMTKLVMIMTIHHVQCNKGFCTGYQAWISDMLSRCTHQVTLKRKCAMQDSLRLSGHSNICYLCVCFIWPFHKAFTQMCCFIWCLVFCMFTDAYLS